MARIDLKEVAHSYLPDTQKIEEYALKHIHMTWEDGGAYALLGPSGCGKTTMLNTVLDRLDENTKVAFIFNTDVTFMQMLIMALVDLGAASSKEKLSKVEALSRLNYFTIQQLAKGINVVLIVDEAQNLDLRTMESMRLLSNLETRKHKLVQIILSGQPELDMAHLAYYGVSLGGIMGSTFLALNDQIGTSIRRALATLNATATMTEMIAAGIQTLRSAAWFPLHASHAASRPTPPTVTRPHPDTAVKVEADSMVRRMYSSVSLAFSRSSCVGIVTRPPLTEKGKELCGTKLGSFGDLRKGKGGRGGRGGRGSAFMSDDSRPGSRARGPGPGATTLMLP